MVSHTLVIVHHILVMPCEAHDSGTQPLRFQCVLGVCTRGCFRSGRWEGYPPVEPAWSCYATECFVVSTMYLTKRNLEAWSLAGVSDLGFQVEEKSVIFGKCIINLYSIPAIVFQKQWPSLSLQLFVLHERIETHTEWFIGLTLTQRITEVLYTRLKFVN